MNNIDLINIIKYADTLSELQAKIGETLKNIDPYSINEKEKQAFSEIHEARDYIWKSEMMLRQIPMGKIKVA